MGAPLKILSGLTPPSTYSEIPQGIHGNAQNTSKSNLPEHASWSTWNHRFLMIIMKV